MMLRNSISNTKKFFQKTLESFKSLLYPGLRTGIIGGGDQGISYQRLPKTPPLNPFSCGQLRRRGVDHMENMSELDDQQIKKEEESWTVDIKKKKINKKKKKNKETEEKSIPPPTLNFDKETTVSATEKFADVRKTDESGTRHVRLCWLAQRLKELEMMIIDKSNLVEHMIDIEEVLLYYSRLTYPTYMDIVDKFYMDLYAEFFFAPQQQQQNQVTCSSRGRGKLPASLFV